MGIALLVLAMGAPAWAEGEGPRFRIHPSIRITGVADDNVLLTGSDREQDVGIWIRPRLEMGYRRRSIDIGGDVGADVRRYLNTRELDQQFLRLHGYAEMGVISGLTLGISDTYTPQPVLLGLPEDDGANLAQTNRLVGHAIYWRELPKGREVEFGVQGTWFSGGTFDSGETVGDSAVVAASDFVPDYYEAAAWSEFQSPLGRRTSSYVRGQFRYRNFPDESSVNFNEFTILTGIRTRWLRNLDFDIGGGYGAVLFDSLGTRNRFLAEATLRYRLPNGWVWHMSANNRFTSDLVGNHYVETTGRLGVEKYFGERTSAALTGFLTRADNEAWPGSNLFGAVEAKIRRQLSRRTQLSLAYRYWKNGGDYDFDDLRQNRLMLELAYRR